MQSHNIYIADNPVFSGAKDQELNLKPFLSAFIFFIVDFNDSITKIFEFFHIGINSFGIFIKCSKISYGMYLFRLSKFNVSALNERKEIIAGNFSIFGRQVQLLLKELIKDNQLLFLSAYFKKMHIILNTWLIHR